MTRLKAVTQIRFALEMTWQQFKRWTEERAYDAWPDDASYLLTCRMKHNGDWQAMIAMNYRR
ncbi:MAG: hypothetical protein ACYS1A_19760, partial [Planctomycetota bacterium]